MLFKAQIQSSNSDWVNKLFESIALLEKVWNSPEFKDEIFQPIYYGKATKGILWWKRTISVNAKKFHYTDKTRTEVYSVLMKGAEELSSEEDNEADLIIVVDPRTNRNVIGYTMSHDPRQYIYANRVRDMNLAEIASNIAHEYCHKLGFDHEFNQTSMRQFSVPYYIGTIVEKLAAKIK